jgi:hypothetical protein
LSVIEKIGTEVFDALLGFFLLGGDKLFFG